MKGELLDLEVRHNPHCDSGNQFHWSRCAPFVENKRGKLIHRPRMAATYTIHKIPHVAFTWWCNAHACGNDKTISVLFEPPKESVLCERCEINAVKAGLPPASELVGRHVHIGNVKVVKECCNG